MDDNKLWLHPGGNRDVKPLPEGLDDPRKLADAILEAAWAKNGFDTRLLDVSTLVSYTDLFVILTGRSDRHVLAIADEIEARMKAAGVLPLGVEGRKSGTWVLLDYGSVVVHIFEKGTRQFYDLERLWVDAPSLPVTEPEWVLAFARQSADYGEFSE